MCAGAHFEAVHWIPSGAANCDLAHTARPSRSTTGRLRRSANHKTAHRPPSMRLRRPVFPLSLPCGQIPPLGESVLGSRYARSSLEIGYSLNLYGCNSVVSRFPSHHHRPPSRFIRRASPKKPTQKAPSAGPSLTRSITPTPTTPLPSRSLIAAHTPCRSPTRL